MPSITCLLTEASEDTLSIRDFAYYLVKTLAVVAFLSFAKDCAPILPAWALPGIFLVYAVTATVGSMYDVVTTRLHRQNLYNENGKLSHYNRRWVVWFGGLFVAYLVLSVLFVLQAPSWDRGEWLLIWVAPLTFYGVFQLVQSAFRKEYSARYYKARAIRWSIVISALTLTTLYALVASQSPTDIQIDLDEIVQGRYMPFENSPAGLLAELDKLTTYSNCLTEYGVGKIVSTSYVIALIVNLVVGFSVYAGVVSLFGACLLSRQEIMSEFRLLPTDDSSEGIVQLRYVAVLIVLWIGLSGVFVWLNCTAEEIRASNEYTLVDQWINDTSRWITLVAEENIEDVKRDHEAGEAARDFEKKFEEEKSAFIDKERPATRDQVNAYYDDCLSNVDSYVSWYEGMLTGAVRIIPLFGENLMRDEFDKQVINPVSHSEVDRQYAVYFNGLNGLYDEYWGAEEIAGGHKQAYSSTAEDIVATHGLSSELRLWPSQDSEEGKKFVQEILLGKGPSDDYRGIKERIEGYVEQQRNRVLGLVDSLSGYFFSE